MAGREPSEVVTRAGRTITVPRQPQRLSRAFYARPTLEVAASLLGRTFYRRNTEGTVAGRVVEVEAYCGLDDPGSHAFRGMTKRNQTMFGPGGHLYVYFTYGMHHCANVVTSKHGIAGAVLLRAVEPLEGLELMAARRGVGEPGLLAKGPGRLCQAFALTRMDDDTDLTDGDVWFSRGRRLRAPVRSSSRIGLRPEWDQPWRLFEVGPWVSGPASLNRG
ncbi:MAG: DNA-3-methyladenine glycosylase [Actinomycetota bacterium]